MVGVLLQIWNVLTSCSERIDPHAVPQKRCCSASGIFRKKWPVVLLQRCCSRSGILSPVAAVLLQIWHILNFRQDSWWFLESSSQVSGALQRNYQQVFFLSSHQSGQFWNLITSFYVWFLAHRREAHFWDTAVVHVSHIPLMFLNRPVWLTSAEST